MDFYFLKLLLSFIIGGIWVTLITIIAEKYGPKYSGIVSAIPSTTFIALFFIGWTQSIEVASQTTTLIPIVGGINTLFVVIYLLMIKRGFVKALLSSLLFWLLTSLLLAKLVLII